MVEKTEKDLYQLLGASFCHDLASPINASGLIWEALEGALAVHDRQLARQNQGSLLMLLEFYRIFFAHRPPQHLFARALALLRTLAKEQQVLLAVDPQLDDVEDPMGKILALLAYMFRGNLQSGDALVLDAVPRGVFSLKFKTKIMLPYQDVQKVVTNPSGGREVQREHFLPHCQLLRETLAVSQRTLRVLPSAGMLECLIV